MIKSFVIIAVLFMVFASVSAVADSSGVYINEFESKPPVSLSDWVELYNGNSASVDISGWKIYDGLPSVTLKHTVPNGTILDANGFYTVNVSGLDTSEFVILINSANETVDQTPQLADTHTDPRTWSRVPDGTGSFVFQNGTRGLTNYLPGTQNATDTSIIVRDLSSPACVIETDNVTLNATVIGNCTNEVIFSFENNGGQINLTGVSAGTNKYHATILGNQLEGSSWVYWRVFARNCFNQTNQSSEESFYVNSKTYLEINPSMPNGQNGWYISEPSFALSNPDASKINYSWNGEYYVYHGPFGLEGTPNEGNVTGGILVLRYRSNVCDEEQREFVGKFDFAAPAVTNLEPASGEIVQGYSFPTISALLDDTYQSNSGINKTSVLMFVDGIQVQANVTNISNTKAYVRFTPVEALSEGQHLIEVEMADNAGRTSYKNWIFEVVGASNLGLTINKPVEGVYFTKKVGFNITATEEVELIELINYGEPNSKFKTLCRKCGGYGYDKIKTRSLLEGENRLTIRVIDKFGNFIDKSVNVLVDSKNPIIVNTEPKDGLSSGTFKILFREDNPTALSLYYGDSEDSRVAEVNLSSCLEERSSTECEIAVDLSDFDGKTVDYMFRLNDIAGNSEDSKEKSTKADTTAPVINMFYHNINGRNVNFLFNVTEENFDSISYIDYEESRPRQKDFCTRLEKGNLCERRKIFSVGSHDLRIEAVDKAGNVAVIAEHLAFDVL